MNAVDVSSDSRLRFDLAIQQSRAIVYTAGCATGLIGRAFGVFPLRLDVAVVFWVASFLACAAFYLLLRRGANSRVINVLSMAVDVAFGTFGVYATGGISSPWFIWYLACAASAAFVAGHRAAVAVSAANTASYLAMLTWMGQATLFNDVFLIALTRILFLFGASYFLLQVGDAA